MKNTSTQRAMIPNGTPIPIPILAPVDSPPGPGVDVGELVPIVAAVVALGDEVVADVEDDVSAVCEKTFKSELCHYTGTPSPYRLYVRSLAVVVSGVVGAVDTHTLLPSKDGSI